MRGSAKAIPTARLSLSSTSRGVPLGAHSAAPKGHVNTAQTHLIYRWNILSRGPTISRHDRIGFDLATAHELEGIGDRVAHQINPSGQQVLYRRSAAAVGPRRRLAPTLC